MERFSFSEDKVNNPLNLLWLWIGLNTASQVIDLVETGLYTRAVPEDQCMIIPNDEVGNNILVFIFAILTLDMGYLATIWYYFKLRRQTAVESRSRLSSSNFSEEIRVNSGLEMLSNPLI